MSWRFKQHSFFGPFHCKWLKMFILISCMSLLLSCGFRLQGQLQLAQPLRTLYLQTPDPYGHLARNLRNGLRLSNVRMVDNPQQASTILTIQQDSTNQALAGVNSTTLTRQYVVSVTVVFSIIDPRGRTILPNQTLTASRVFTTQSTQILGSSNELNLYYQQMRVELANAILYRIASQQVTQLINARFHENK